MNVSINVVRALGAALLVAGAGPVLAELGGNAASVEVDRAQMRGQAVNISAGLGFTVHELSLPTGTVVREYLSPAGKIFAVTWRGPVIPNLRQTLGSYYGTFRATVNSATRGPDHRHLTVRQPGLVVHSHGRMRDYRGMVYVPSLLPQGVSADDIR